MMTRDADKKENKCLCFVWMTWFLGLDMLDEVPHFSTFGKNYTRRFKDTDLFEQIFSHILEECMKHHLVDTSAIFADATKDKDNHNQTPPSCGGGTASGEGEEIPEGAKTQKCSTSDPNSGWFRKGEHKHVFAYGIETACDKL